MLCSSVLSSSSVLRSPVFHLSAQSSSFSKYRNCVNTRSDNSVNPTKFWSSPANGPLCTTHSYDLCSERNPDVENSSTLPMAQWVDPSCLQFWLQSSRSIEDVKIIHCIVLKFLETHMPFVYNNLIGVYLRFGRLVDARKVFDQMPIRNVVTWTAILNGYSKFRLDEEALSLFNLFIEGGGHPNGQTFVCALNLCGKRLDLELGKQIHACVLKGNVRSMIVDTAIVHFYAKCGDLEAAFCAFDGMPERDVVSWTTLVAFCSQQGREEEAFYMFTRMLSEQIFPNEFTVSSVLKACGGKKILKFGKQLHGLVAKKVVTYDVVVGTSLVDMYSECRVISDSRKIFDRMQNRNTVTWTSMVAGYARNGLASEAIILFRSMIRQNVFANNLTIVSILRACGLIGNFLLGKEVHARIVKNSNLDNIHVGSTLVWFYCQCGRHPCASKVLQLMPSRDVISWTAMISGCARLGHEPEALELLKQMVDEGVEPNHFTYSSALKACAKQEAILQGKSIHCSLNKTPDFSNVFVGSALIGMYSKCGLVSEALRVFNGMPERNIVSWKAMIAGYARNGLCKEALKLMYRMQAAGIEVEDYVISTVLTACEDVDWTADLSLVQLLRSS